MKWIAHRGNLNGPRSDRENHPDQIDYCIDQGYDVEIDIRRFGENNWFLGHDHADHKVDLTWILDRSTYLWIHCKNQEALDRLCELNRNFLNFFWHENDQFTMTSRGYIWDYPSVDFRENHVCVMPEWNHQTYGADFILPDEHKKCYAICSDYVKPFKETNP